ncbi:MAG: Lrp/AsnC family transcriptional regulator [Pseudomonadales bacterium]|jgi:Lrp/AsnC family transcriptional regulator
MTTQHDKTDLKILQKLQVDASLSVAELAEQTGISKSACWRRLQKLEESGYIKGRVTLVDQDKVNLPITVYIQVRTNQHNVDWAKKFKQVIASIPQILEVARMSGDLDYLVKAVVPDMKGYDDLYNKMLQADLFDVSASFVLEQMKYTTELPLDFA